MSLGKHLRETRVRQMAGTPKCLADPEVLRAFALGVLRADLCPLDNHVFSLDECETCGIAPLLVTVEHHTGSGHGDFHGRITAQCGLCDRIFEALRKTGEALNPATGKLAPRARERTQQAKCRCGNAAFFVASCHRFETAEGGGLAGFYDEGVVVGQCPQCGQCHVFAYLD